MTRPNTLRRREKRQRAKARAAERQRRYDAMTPEERERQHTFITCYTGPALNLLRQQLVMANIVSRGYLR